MPSAKKIVIATAVIPVRNRKLVSITNPAIRWLRRMIAISAPKAPIKKKE